MLILEKSFLWQNFPTGQEKMILKSRMKLWCCADWGLTYFFGHGQALGVDDGGEFLLLQLLDGVLVVSQVQLGAHQDDGSVGAVVSDLRVPLKEGRRGRGSEDRQKCAGGKLTRQILKKHSKTKEKVSALQSRLAAPIPRDAFSPRNWHPLTTLSPIRWCHMMVFVILWSRHTLCLVLLTVFLHLQHSTLNNTSYLQVKFTSELKWCAVVRSQALTSADLRNTFQVTKIFHRYSKSYCAAVSKGCFDSFLCFRKLWMYESQARCEPSTHCSWQRDQRAARGLLLQ